MLKVGAKDRRIDGLTKFIQVTAFDTRVKIPETVIDNFVDQIVYDHGAFIWVNILKVMII